MSNFSWSTYIRAIFICLRIYFVWRCFIIKGNKFILEKVFNSLTKICLRKSARIKKNFIWYYKFYVFLNSYLKNPSLKNMSTETYRNILEKNVNKNPIAQYIIKTLNVKLKQRRLVWILFFIPGYLSFSNKGN